MVTKIHFAANCFAGGKYKGDYPLCRTKWDKDYVVVRNWEEVTCKMCRNRGNKRD